MQFFGISFERNEKWEMGEQSTVLLFNSLRVMYIDRSGKLSEQDVGKSFM